jgi:hypothetical protein
MLALETSASAPVVMRGIIPSWERLGRPAEDGAWHERVLPARFRPSFAAVPGLEAYAVGLADALPEALRTPAWRKLVELCGRFDELTLPEKSGLAQVLGQLCLFPQLERLLPADGTASRLGEQEAALAYWRALTPFMLYEPDWLDRTQVFLRIAEAAPRAGRARLIAALKFLILNLEHRRECPELMQGRKLAEDALEELRARAPDWEASIWTSKWWRTVCYFPFHKNDFERLERELGSALDCAERAIGMAAGAGPFARSFAEENLHAVLATWGVTLMHLGRAPDAVPWFERMVAADPQGSWQRIGLGKALLAAGESDRAADAFEKGFELAALGRDQACEGLALCMAKLGRADDERRWREQASRLRASVDAAQPPPGI